MRVGVRTALSWRPQLRFLKKAHWKPGAHTQPFAPRPQSFRTSDFGSLLPRSAVLRTSLTKSDLRISISIHSLAKKKEITLK